MTTTTAATTNPDDVISLLLALSEFGRLVTDVLVEVTGDRDIVRNSPIITLACWRWRARNGRRRPWPAPPASTTT